MLQELKITIFLEVINITSTGQQKQSEATNSSLPAVFFSYSFPLSFRVHKHLPKEWSRSSYIN